MSKQEHLDTSVGPPCDHCLCLPTHCQDRRTCGYEHCSERRAWAVASRLADFIEQNVPGAQVYRDTGLVVT